MALADYSPEIDARIREGSTTKDAISTVAMIHDLSVGGLTAAYYRDRQKRGIGRGKRRKAPKVIPAAATAPPASSNGGVTIEELIAQLKVNHAENDRIMTQLEALVWDHTQRLAEVRAALTA